MNRKGIKRIGLMSLLVLSLLIFAPAGRAQAAGTGTVKNRVVNVRSNATTASSIVAKLTQGTSVSITSETTGSDGRKWYNVSFKYNGSNKTGCIRADLLNATGTNTGTSAANTSTASVSGFGDDSILAIRVNSARVRKQASISAAMVTTLNKDDQVKQKTAVTGSDGKTWIRVSFTKGGQKTYGYIRSDLLTLVKKGDDLHVKTPEEAKGVDLLIISVKYGALQGILPMIEKIVDAHTLVISPMNGVDSEKVIGEKIGMEHMLPSFMKIASRRIDNQIVYDPEVTMGLYFGEDNGEPSERTEAIEDLLKDTPIHHHLSANIQQDIGNCERNYPGT